MAELYRQEGILQEARGLGGVDADAFLVKAYAGVDRLADTNIFDDAIGKGVGEVVSFGGLLGEAPIMPVHRESSEKFINRGGRIPAPIHSLRN